MAAVSIHIHADGVQTVRKIAYAPSFRSLVFHSKSLVRAIYDDPTMASCLDSRTPLHSTSGAHKDDELLESAMLLPS